MKRIPSQPYVVLLLLWMTALLLGLEVVHAQEEDEAATSATSKRLGRQKKKVNGTLYASYGLSPDVAAEPAKLIKYSKAAVSAASTAAAASSTTQKKATTSSHRLLPEGAEPSAPGTQAKVDLRPYMSAIENQSQSNSCAANAVAGAYEYLATRAALRDDEEEVGEISRLFIYYVGRKRDQSRWGENTWQKPKDEGMTLAGAIEAVQLKGAALQSSWPFALTNVNQRPPSEAFEEAIRYKVGDAMSIPLNLDAMRQCLNDGYPIIFGLKLTQAFFMPPYNGFIPTPDPSDPQSASHGMHAMLIVGYNDRQRVFIVRNSWGTGWGVDGYCFLSYDYVANPEFNFVGQYAIQSLSDDDLTPDEDDEDDFVAQGGTDADPTNTTPYIELEIDDHFDDEEEDEEDDFDADDMFDSKAEARRAFVHFAGNKHDMAMHNLLLSKDELFAALKLMGIPMVSQDEMDWVFGIYDDDNSGMINFEEFLDMQALFDGSLLERRRKLNRMKKEVSRWARRAKEYFFGGSGSSGGGGGDDDTTSTTTTEEEQQEL